ncbi:MAG: hypothetical protein K2H70_02850, partial [Bacteroidales bacterium]|nr:hypothetical protein [Bacteroidales bacterium]
DGTVAPYIDFIMDFASIRPEPETLNEIQPLPSRPLPLQPLANGSDRPRGKKDVEENYGDRI